ncbi:MAG: prealbumin-like fold domain-containing protein [Gemmiger formicilis]|uniref:prealbumin-like fold domain-containing protein n=1 Tax=Gemmiger formicilis TaxID=745368 RepID=UPI003A256E10
MSIRCARWPVRNTPLRLPRTFTQDRQLDANGSRTLWYAKGDVVAVVTTGDGSADTAVFAPPRTKATYDFLSVIHAGTLGEVSITLPLGSYHVEETKPPYGYVGTTDSYDVTFLGIIS